MKNALMKRLVGVAILSCMATCGMAEDAAPVFDADNYPPQFDAPPSGTSTRPPPITQPKPTQASEPIELSPEQRLTDLEQQLNRLKKVDSAAKVVELQSEVQSLRGQVEQLSHQLQQLQTTQSAQYVDLDKRLNSKSIVTQAPIPETSNVTELASLPQSASPTKAKPLGHPIKAMSSADASVSPQPIKNVATATQPNVAEEQEIYQTAYDLIKVKKYNEAIQALQKMLQKYPSGQFAANAHYWLGELYGLLGKNELSAVEFATVVKNYPDSPKVSDAELKLGLIYAAEFKWADSKVAFKKVISRFPGTSSSRLAAQQLKQMKQSGH